MNIDDYRNHISELSPAGCYVALRVGFYAPETELNLFSRAWIDHYTLAGHALADPLLLWCHQNDGYGRWSEIADMDQSHILRDYHSFGYRFGCVISIMATATAQKRSLGIFARSDREPREAEMKDLTDLIHQIHDYQPVNLTVAQQDALRLYSQGYRLKQIAYELSISVSAVKARLRSAAERLEVSTSREAALIAVSRGLL